MICAVYFTQGRINCLLPWLFNPQVYPKSQRRVRIILLSSFLSHGSSEGVKIQNQRLYEIGGNIGKHSLMFLLLHSLITLKEI